MSENRTPLVNGEYYHVFNRGVAHQPTFLHPSHYKQAIFDFSYYRFALPPIRLSYLKRLLVDQRQQILQDLEQEDNVLVKIIGFCLMPNHFHFLLQQIHSNGISTFMSKFTNSYTKYFNTKEDRVGPLFQGLFKAVHIETTEQLLHVSRYIHLNPLIGFVVKEKNFLSYPYSSLAHYLNLKPSLITSEPVLENFSSTDAYREFVLDQVNYANTLASIKHLTFD